MQIFESIALTSCLATYLNNRLTENLPTQLTTRAIWKVRGLAVARRCYAEGGRDCYAKL
jgi:hypothetical protein